MLQIKSDGPVHSITLEEEKVQTWPNSKELHLSQLRRISQMNGLLTWQ